jgi:hypothetical protein
MENTKAYQEAKKKVEARLGFKVHLTVYLVVNAILITVNLMNSPDNLWFLWPLLGWTIGIFWHAMGVYVFKQKSGVVEKMIQREMDKQISKTE